MITRADFDQHIGERTRRAHCPGPRTPSRRTTLTVPGDPRAVRHAARDLATTLQIGHCPTDAAFDQFATGFDSGFGASGSLDGSRKSIETLDGVTYVCAPLVSDVSGTICMWQDQEVFWLLFDFSGDSFQAGKTLAERAHDAAGDR